MDYVEIVSLTLPVVGIVASGLISWLVAKNTAASEMEKLKVQWEREDSAAYENDFVQMVKSVSYHISYHQVSEIGQARVSVARIRAKVGGKLGDALDNLYFVIMNKSVTLSEVEAALNEVIKVKRSYEPYHKK